MPAPKEITPKQLDRLLGIPNCPQIIDLRIEEDFAKDPLLIPTAQRFSHENIEEWAKHLVGQHVVVSCHKGLKISQGACALLNAMNVKAEYLQGGHVAWAQDDHPLIKPLTNTALWVTRHRPKIDRIACPWLIRRFINPKAQFLFVSPSQVLSVAEKFNATAFDVPDCDWTHKGAFCTFDAILSGFGITSPALSHMARIVRAADTNSNSDEPEAAGLLALSLGLSRMYRDDLQQLENGLLLYDALYRWARDATNETHVWDEKQ